jgi:hypothetical protein
VSCRRCSPNAPFARLEMADGGAAVNWLSKNLRATPQRLHKCSVGRTEGPARLPQPFSYSTTARSDRRGRDQRLHLRLSAHPHGNDATGRHQRRRHQPVRQGIIAAEIESSIAPFAFRLLNLAFNASRNICSDPQSRRYRCWRLSQLRRNKVL